MDGQNVSGGATVEIAAGFPGCAAETLTRTQRLARRAALDPVDVERALTYVVAHLGGFAVDEQLFRHDLPAELLDAACVRLTGEAEDESPDFRSFTVLFSGREVTCGAISEGVPEVLGKLPQWWLTVSGGALASPVELAEIELFSPARFGAAVAGGRRVAEFEAELFVRVCTSPHR